MSSTVAGPSKATKKKLATSKSFRKKLKDRESVPDAAGISSDPKYEGTKTEWDYEPPEGTVLANHDVDAEEFDFDALKGDENLELWIVRVPNAVKSKHLAALRLDAPSSTTTGLIGTFEKSTVQYNVWSLGEDGDDHVGGEELKNLTCLVPRKKKGGKLYAAPSIATRHIVIAAQASLPAPPQLRDGAEFSSSGENTSFITYTNPPRPSYPVEALKHKFVPLGALARTSHSNVSDSGMVLDRASVEDVELLEQVPVVKKERGKKKTEAGEVKTKKRKVDEGSSPKKQKKAKRDST